MQSINERLSGRIITVRDSLAVKGGLGDLMTPDALAEVERHLSNARQAMAENNVIEMARAYAALQHYAK